jgi:hypothetical protein
LSELTHLEEDLIKHLEQRHKITQRSLTYTLKDCTFYI